MITVRLVNDLLVKIQHFMGWVLLNASRLRRETLLQRWLLLTSVF